MTTVTLLRTRLEEPVLQRLSRHDALLGVVLQHAEQQVLELGVVGDGVPGFTGPSPARSPRFHSQYLVQGSATGR